jgi:catechol 2,3-dioxygenase
MIKLLNQLTDVRLTTPDVEASVRFYEEHIGLRVVGREDGAVYLRSWGDYYGHSLVLLEGDETTLACMTWRTESADALEEAVRRLGAEGVAGIWTNQSFGLGRSFTFTGPWGHTMQLVWEIDRYHGTGEFASTYPDRPERRSDKGIAPRFLDHVTITASDVRGFADWYSRILGFRIMAHTTLEQGGISMFSVITTNEKSHDLGIVRDASTRPGRVNHYAFWVDTREELLRAADLLIERGVPIEYGPSIHGIGEQSFLYFRDPSGMRVEINTGGYRNYVPDWEAYEWHPHQGSANFYRNGKSGPSMAESFPAADGPSASEEGVVPGTEHAFFPDRVGAV